MAVRFEDVLDEARIRRETEEGCVLLETTIDDFLRSNFYDGSTAQKKFSISFEKRLRRASFDIVLDRYAAVGWNMEWDGDTKNPYIFFSPVMPEQKKQGPPASDGEKAGRDPWYAFWR